MTSLTENLKAPYFAAIMKSSDAAKPYAEPADDMVALATRQPGFLGLETALDPDGRPVTVSYWSDQVAIEQWKAAGAARIGDGASRLHIERACELRVTRVGGDMTPGSSVGGMIFTDAREQSAA